MVFAVVAGVSMGGCDVEWSEDGAAGAGVWGVDFVLTINIAARPRMAMPAISSQVLFIAVFLRKI